MAQYMSPGITVNEYDFSQVVIADSSTTGAICGVFKTGPINRPTLITSEAQLVEVFGKPIDSTYGISSKSVTFFTAANFLQYSNSLWVVRVISDTAYNAQSSNTTAIQILSDDDYTENWFEQNSTDSKWASKNMGLKYNNLSLYVCSNPMAWSSKNSTVKTFNNLKVSWALNGGANTTLQLSANIQPMFLTSTGQAQNPLFLFEAQITANSKATIIVNFYEAGSSVSHGATTTLQFSAAQVKKFKDIGLTTLTNVPCEINWIFKRSFGSDVGPSTSLFAKQNSLLGDEMHIMIADWSGKVSGTPGATLETFSHLSKLSDAKNTDGSSNYYVEVLQQKSKYIYALNNKHPNIWNVSSGSFTSNTVTYIANTPNFQEAFYTGADGGTPNAGDIMDGYNYFANQDLNISLLLGGNGGGCANVDDAFTVLNKVASIATERMDCMAFISHPLLSDVLVARGKSNSGVISNLYDNFTSNLSDALNTYTVLDGSWKYHYDKYWNKYRWSPMNGDIAGLVAQTETQRDAWWSPAGLNRGKVKGAIKLSWEPNKAERDQIYASAINPVITIRNEGIVLYGDKTADAKPSAFDRINVRRLFITLEKAIADAAKYSLFEFNDEFTRAQFVSIIEPYLRDVQGRRGIYEFKVVCDDTNNTPEVIDQNRFVGNIYIKPTRSINYIELNFVAVGTGVDFNTITGMDGI